jgi:hypothetical protein
MKDRTLLFLSLVLSVVALSYAAWVHHRVDQLGSDHTTTYEEISVLKTASPKLRRFLADHPAASQAIAGAISNAFTNRTVALFYLYCDDEYMPRADHYYPAEAQVCIVIRENQEPCDEFISLIFEILNSQGEKRFNELTEQAKSGAMSKSDYVKEVRRQEFQALKKVRGLLGGLKFSRSERSKSYFFGRVTEIPDDFEKFLTNDPKGMTIFEQRLYEQSFDSIRKNP